MRLALCALMLTLAVAGCGSPPRATVEGVVTLDGKPLADVEVQFIPEPGQGGQPAPASGYTDKDGRYRIDATATGGVSVGTYRVCVNDAKLMMPGGGTDPNDGMPGAIPKTDARRSRVPQIYSDATQTPHRNVAVRPGVQTVDLDLKLKP